MTVKGNLKSDLYHRLNMHDADSHRKARLASLISTRFGGVQKDFAVAARISEGRVTQLLKPEQSFGERSARNICRALDLSPRYFEQQDQPGKRGATDGQRAADGPGLSVHEIVDGFDAAVQKLSASRLEELRELLAPYLRSPAKYRHFKTDIERVLSGEEPSPGSNLEKSSAAA